MKINFIIKVLAIIIIFHLLIQHFSKKNSNNENNVNLVNENNENNENTAEDQYQAEDHPQTEDLTNELLSYLRNKDNNSENVVSNNLDNNDLSFNVEGNTYDLVEQSDVNFKNAFPPKEVNPQKFVDTWKYSKVQPIENGLLSNTIQGFDSMEAYWSAAENCMVGGSNNGQIQESVDDLRMGFSERGMKPENSGNVSGINGNGMSSGMSASFSEL